MLDNDIVLESRLIEEEPKSMVNCMELGSGAGFALSLLSCVAASSRYEDV